MIRRYCKLWEMPPECTNKNPVFRKELIRNPRPIVAIVRIVEFDISSQVLLSGRTAGPTCGLSYRKTEFIPIGGGDTVRNGMLCTGLLKTFYGFEFAKPNLKSWFKKPGESRAPCA
jgi:hypothetical protein